MNFEPVKALLDHLTAWRIPGNDISIYLQGKEVYRYQSGYSDAEKQIPMRDDLLFNIYSCSKPATVTAALQLLEQKKFTLDTPVYEFLPSFKAMTVKEANGDVRLARTPMTMRHLFTMTSGMNYNRSYTLLDRVRAATDGRMDTLAVVRAWAEMPLEFEPGTSWRYGWSHDVLAAVVEVISGMKFREYMQHYIFDPLEMTTACYHNESVQDQMCELYQFENGETDYVAMQSGAVKTDGGRLVKMPKQVDFVFGPEYDSGGAGITVSVADYVKLVSMLSMKGVAPNGERLLQPKTVDLMCGDHLNAEQKAFFNWPQLAGYSYGLGVRTLSDPDHFTPRGNLGEIGWGGAAGATVLADTSIGLAVFYTHHMLNPQEEYYQPRLRNAVYASLQ